MMNKGFEVIEAKWLFGVQPSQIEVVVHPQSVIHSMVQFEDGAVKAQLDARYAPAHPVRILLPRPYQLFFRQTRFLPMHESDV